MSNKNKQESLLDDVEFEMDFFAYIANTTNFEVIPIPDIDGFIPNDQEYELISKDCKKRSVKLLYRVSNGKYALVYGADLDKVGLVPEDNPHGFCC